MTTPAENETKKSFTIVVNAENKDWDKKKIDYEQVVHIAFPNPPPNVVITYTIEYENGPPENPEGSLTKGHSVDVQDGMIFSVTETGRS
jgi:hypothetical protein